jgi:hypothetical protein
MTFKISKITTASTRVKVLEADPKRTHADIYNESGETVRYGDKSVTYAAGGGQVITNGQHALFYRQIGTDPTSERWIIGSAGGTVTVIEEWA